MQKRTITRMPSGIAGLDDILFGGFASNRLYLVEGTPGVGKTTLAMQFLLEGVRQGERCLYVTLSETRDEMEEVAASHGWSLEGIDVIELVTRENALDGEDDLTMFHPSDVELTETTRTVLEAVQRVNPQRMVLDSLSELRMLAQTSLRYRRQILALKRFFVGRGCTILLLDDRTGDDPDFQLQSIAHGVISLNQSTPPYGPALRQLQVVKFRGSGFRTGLQDLVLRHGGLEVFPRLTAAEHGCDFQRETVPSGVIALDDLLGGGIDRGTATLLVGPPGSGKSTIALQYAVAAARRGHHAAIFTFEEARTLLMHRARGLGIPIQEGVGPGHVAVRQIDPAEVLPGEFAHMIRSTVERDAARVVVIDSLNGYLNAMPEERALTTQLHELLTYLGNHGVATFMVTAQTGLIGPGVRSPIDASYLADSVVMLRMYEHEGTVRRAISVVKKRSGHHEDTIRRLWFDADGVHLSEPLMHLRGVLSGVPTEVEPAQPRGRAPPGFADASGS